MEHFAPVIPNESPTHLVRQRCSTYSVQASPSNTDCRGKVLAAGCWTSGRVRAETRASIDMPNAPEGDDHHHHIHGPLDRSKASFFECWQIDADCVSRVTEEWAESCSSIPCRSLFMRMPCTCSLENVNRQQLEATPSRLWGLAA